MFSLFSEGRFCCVASTYCDTTRINVDSTAGCPSFLVSGKWSHCSLRFCATCSPPRPRRRNLVPIASSLHSLFRTFCSCNWVRATSSSVKHSACLIRGCMLVVAVDFDGFPLIPLQFERSRFLCIHAEALASYCRSNHA